MQVVGLDIGGANLKAADGDGGAATRDFPLWREPRNLAAALRGLIGSLMAPRLLAVTMTGELADCFETKAEGVDFILRAVEEAAPGVPAVVWQTGGEFVTPEDAREIPMLVAAANWHALATWVGRVVPRGAALLVDIGTTTTDVIPLLDGVPVPAGLTDRERLQSGELVYTGVRRTPLCAVAPAVPFRGSECPIAAELFATTLDVYLLLGAIPEDAADTNTANGRPATRAAAHDRLARTLCCDRREFDMDDALIAARFLAERQRRQIAAAVERVLVGMDRDVDTVLISGSGAFVAERLLGEHPRLRAANLVRLADVLRPELSEAACAFAVARLAAERVTL